MNGLFVTFEANEGAGKSTQVKLLADRLTKEGHDVVLTREPGGSPGAEEIRNLVVTGEPGRWSARTELLLFMAARNDHVEKTVKPALERGAIVICDRYVGSTLALQVAGGEDPEFIVKSHNDFIGLWPDLTYFLKISPEVSVQRAMAVNGNESRFELKGKRFHQKVNDAFESQVKSHNWTTINGDGTIESVHEKIWEDIQTQL